MIEYISLPSAKEAKGTSAPLRKGTEKKPEKRAVLKPTYNDAGEPITLGAPKGVMVAVTPDDHIVSHTFEDIIWVHTLRDMVMPDRPIKEIVRDAMAQDVDPPETPTTWIKQAKKAFDKTAPVGSNYTVIDTGTTLKKVATWMTGLDDDEDDEDEFIVGDPEEEMKVYGRVLNHSERGWCNDTGTHPDTMPTTLQKTDHVPSSDPTHKEGHMSLHSHKGIGDHTLPDSSGPPQVETWKHMMDDYQWSDDDDTTNDAADPPSKNMDTWVHGMDIYGGREDDPPPILCDSALEMDTYGRVLNETERNWCNTTGEHPDSMPGEAYMASAPHPNNDIIPDSASEVDMYGYVTERPLADATDDHRDFLPTAAVNMPSPETTDGDDITVSIM